MRKRIQEHAFKSLLKRETKDLAIKVYHGAPCDDTPCGLSADDPDAAKLSCVRLAKSSTKGVPGGHGFRQNLHAASDPVALMAAIDALRHQTVA